MTEEPLFNSTHAALTFAFNFAGQQSPKTPLMRMFQSNPGEDDMPRGIRQGKGLTGLDGAAQAGMILAEVCRLPDDQHNIIVARYYRTTHECKCCGQQAPREEWLAAIDALSHCVELEGVHRKVRLMMVEKVCGGKLDNINLSKIYSLSSRTIYRQLSDIKMKFKKLERIAMINLDNAFTGSKLLSA